MSNLDADFLLERANRTLAEVEAQIYEGGYLPLNWSDNQHFKLARIARYQTSRANSVTKVRKAIEDYRKNRRNEVIKAEKQATLNRGNSSTLSISEQIVQSAKDYLEHLRKVAENDPTNAQAVEAYRSYRQLMKDKGHL